MEFAELRQEAQYTKKRSAKDTLEHFLRLCEENKPPSTEEQRTLVLEVASRRTDLFREFHTHPETLTASIRRLQQVSNGERGIKKTMRYTNRGLHTFSYYQHELPERLSRMDSVIGTRNVESAIDRDGDTIADVLGGLPFKTERTGKMIEVCGTRKTEETDAKLDAICEAYRAYRDCSKFTAMRNVRLLYKTAMKYRDKGVPFVDLLQQASVTSLIAADRFDANHEYVHHAAPGKNVQFQTYMAASIRNALHKKVRRLHDSLDRVQIDPIERLDCDEWLDPVDHREENPLDAFADREQQQDLQQIFNVLDPRELDILMAVNGVGMYEGRPETERQIAERIGVHKSRVNELKKRAIRKLRQRYNIVFSAQSAALLVE